MSRSRAVGTAAETCVVRALREDGFPYAERRALHGAVDLGDITGTPGLAWQVKATRRLDLPGDLRATAAQRLSAGADYGLLIIKPVGYGDSRVDEWVAAMHFGPMRRLLHGAGYGDFE